MMTTVVGMAQQSDDAVVAMATEDVVEQTEGVELQAQPTMTPNEARKQRGFSTNTCFVPKGQWIFGGTASYSAHVNENYKVLVINDIDSEGYTINVAPMIAFAPWRNMAVGVRFGYGRSLLALDNAALSIGEGDSGINMNVDYYHQIRHSYTGSLFWRPYIPLGESNRIAIFAEVQLNFTGSQSRLVAEDGVIDGLQNYRGRYATTFGASVGLQPGIVAFVTNNTALELSIGVFGIGFERTKQIRNQIEEGTFTSSDMNFRVNLLSVGFGVSFYL